MDCMQDDISKTGVNTEIAGRGEWKKKTSCADPTWSDKGRVQKKQRE